MKTLREMMDQLDEINRRDLLKGAGLGALGAVAGVAGDRLLNQPQQRPTPQQAIADGIKSGKWSLKAYHNARNDGYSDEEIADYLTDYKYGFTQKQEPPAPAVKEASPDAMAKIDKLYQK
jgi:hypothetical protein